MWLLNWVRDAQRYRAIRKAVDINTQRRAYLDLLDCLMIPANRGDDLDRVVDHLVKEMK